MMDAMDGQVGLAEVDETYRAFVEKFKPKKTTDDCYTPENVYNCIADWVAEEYGADKAHFIRPFWPGADYRLTEYGPEDIVVDIIWSSDQSIQDVHDEAHNLLAA